jgi:hypothetical protein
MVRGPHLFLHCRSFEIVEDYTSFKPITIKLDLTSPVA